MEFDCEQCAGCCLDWRPVAPEDVELDHERRGGFEPLDDVYNLAPLSSDEVRQFVSEEFGDAMTPRLFRARESDNAVTIDGYEVAAIEGRVAFLVGLRKLPKPVDPFGLKARWLPGCVFLDPETLQCRIHGSKVYPDTCATYPGENLALDVDSECERVESAFDRPRLLDGSADHVDPSIGPGSLGSRVFAHPDDTRLSGSVSRLVSGESTVEDRAEFVAVAAGSRPGTLTVDQKRYETARESVLSTDSWVGRAGRAWVSHHDRGRSADPSLGTRIEESRGAPSTPGWTDREPDGRNATQH
ncbi:MAG: YkgJ family cysteine cluster protein [Natronomonas sp.]